MVLAGVLQHIGWGDRVHLIHHKLKCFRLRNIVNCWLYNLIEWCLLLLRELKQNRVRGNKARQTQWACILRFESLFYKLMTLEDKQAAAFALEVQKPLCETRE